MAKTRDQAQDLKEEMIETIEVAKTRDQAQDLKEETIEVEETIIKVKVEKENPLALRKILVERKRVMVIIKKNFQEKFFLRINFDR